MARAFRRRAFIAGVAAGAATMALPGRASQEDAPYRERSMYGLIGKMRAVPGQRDALIAILLDGVGGMPACLS